MRRLLIATGCFLAWWAHAFGPVVFLQQQAPAAAAGGWTQDLDTAGTDTRTMGDAAARKHIAWQFLCTGNCDGTLTTVTAYVARTGSPTTETGQIEIWTDNGLSGGDAAPQSMLSSASYDIVDVPTSAANFTFSSALSAPVTNGALYWINFEADSPGTESAVVARFDTSGAYDMNRSADASTWVSLDFSTFLRATIQGN